MRSDFFQHRSLSVTKLKINGIMQCVLFCILFPSCENILEFIKVTAEVHSVLLLGVFCEMNIPQLINLFSCLYMFGLFPVWVHYE